MAGKLIQIGELLHASIPSTGSIMRELIEKGDSAFTADSPQLQKLKDIIASQDADGADFIAINVDDFAQDNPDLAIELMKNYVELVRESGNTTPPCIDSSNDDILIAGLQQWYSGETAGKRPMINSVKTYNTEIILPLKKEYDFCFIALLMSENQIPTNVDEAIGELMTQADEIFDKAMDAGFTADDIFFDTGVYPIAIDMPMMPGQCSYAHRTFETIKRIRQSSKFKGVHFSLGFSNCCRDLPGRRLGIIRAYVAKAMQCGCDAGIVNAKHKFGQSDPDPKLFDLINAFANIDGQPEKLNNAMALMTDFCQSCR